MPDFPSVPCTFDDPTICAVDVDCPHKPLSFQWKLVDRNSTGDWTPECKYLHFRMHKNNLVYEIGLIFWCRYLSIDAVHSIICNGNVCMINLTLKFVLKKAMLSENEIPCKV